jgi:hypothetical protein
LTGVTLNRATVGAVIGRHASSGRP